MQVLRAPQKVQWAQSPQTNKREPKYRHNDRNLATIRQTKEDGSQPGDRQREKCWQDRSFDRQTFLTSADQAPIRNDKGADAYSREKGKQWCLSVFKTTNTRAHAREVLLVVCRQESARAYQPTRESRQSVSSFLVTLHDITVSGDTTPAYRNNLLNVGMMIKTDRVCWKMWGKNWQRMTEYWFDTPPPPPPTPIYLQV